MQEANLNLVGARTRLNKFILPALILLLLAATGMIYYGSAKAESVSSAKIVLSQNALEDQYGLKVSLIGVTAAGGMVDLRLKIVDGAKARILLQEKNNFPALQIKNGAVTLNASEDAKSQEIEFKDSGNLFLLYPNAGNVVRQGTPVTILFGEIALKPIEVK